MRERRTSAYQSSVTTGGDSRLHPLSFQKRPRRGLTQNGKEVDYMAVTVTGGREIEVIAISGSGIAAVEAERVADRDR